MNNCWTVVIKLFHVLFWGMQQKLENLSFQYYEMFQTFFLYFGLLAWVKQVLNQLGFYSFLFSSYPRYLLKKNHSNKWTSSWNELITIFKFIIYWKNFGFVGAWKETLVKLEKKTDQIMTRPNPQQYCLISISPSRQIFKNYYFFICNSIFFTLDFSFVLNFHSKKPKLQLCNCHTAQLTNSLIVQYCLKV